MISDEQPSPARLRALGQLDAVNKALGIFAHEKLVLEASLKDIESADELKRYPNSFVCAEPLNPEGGLWHFLHDKILEPHAQKDGLKYAHEDRDGRILSIRWSEVSEAHCSEIINAATWCQNKAKEAARRVQVE